ncbi:hypothetical protein [Streptomyces sp. NRRL F-5053]|uniref:hypothetical protein n=1 Tax=Streptomyces sp. NRRL F-5053 TaxID=1463854 RepID=UPI001331AB5C|nr:hypothetical protein [Streptomyces sp. NRRL F-5053]
MRGHLISGEEYLAEDVALDMLHAALEAKTVVSIVGPVDMELKATELVECFMDTVNTRRDMVYPDGVINPKDRDFGVQFVRFDAARSTFVAGARDILTT